MIKLRKSEDRGRGMHGWLDSRHTFSFARYYDPEHLGFRSLRVLNEDRVAPGQGFGTHGHENMEILTYVISGAIAHKDSMGNTQVLPAGAFQRMTAGTGVTHSEYNASDTEPLHFLQIWVLPEKDGLAPGYDEKEPAPGYGVRAIAARRPSNGAMTIHQDVSMYHVRLAPGSVETITLAKDRHAWVQAVQGGAALNESPMRPGDGAAVSEETALTLRETEGETAELLVFDLA